MARLHFMGIINPNPHPRMAPEPGFHLTAFRYYGDDWRETRILVPVEERDRINACMVYKPTDPGCHPIWNDGMISGATRFIPHQAALYPFRFPDNTTYVALRELVVAAIRRWFVERPNQMMTCPAAALEQARAFCEGELPEALAVQMKALAAYASNQSFTRL